MTLEEIHRDHYGRVLATVIRLVGDFDRAEEGVQEAFAAAVAHWATAGPPENPVAWLVSTARHKAIDQIRRDARLAAHRDELERHYRARAEEETPVDEDRLRLIFTCCHPALPPEAQVALTLRTLCGLTTEEIARAFLAPVPTLAQRLVRAKAKIKNARIPYVVPEGEALSERLDRVMAVVYLVFNEGYAASFGERLVRGELCTEAIRLGRMLVELIPERGEPKGLLALMLLHDARRATRLDDQGRLLTLEEQDRSLWDRYDDRRGRPSRGAGAARGSSRTLRPAGRHRGTTRPGRDRRRHGLAPDRRPLQPARPHPPHPGGRAQPRGGRGHGRRSASRPARSSTASPMAAPSSAITCCPRPAPTSCAGWEGTTEAAEAYRRALALVTNDAEKRYLERRLGEVDARPIEPR